MAQPPLQRRAYELARPTEDALGKAELLPRYVFLEPLIAERRILEVGLVAATRGAGARFLASRSARSVLALDPDPEAIAEARQEPVAGVEFVCGGLSDVPDAAFDLIVVTLERSLERAPGFLDKLQQKLAPKGYLCVALRNPAGVTLLQVARGEDREAPPTLGELAQALSDRFASVETVSQTVLLGYHVGPQGSDEAPTLDSALAGTLEPAYFLFVAGTEASHLGEPVLVTLPPAPVAVASNGREELREQLRLAERRYAELLNERAELDHILHARLTELTDAKARLDAAVKQEALQRQQLDTAESRVQQAEASMRAAKEDAAQLDRALTDSLRQLELERSGQSARLAEAADAHRAREAAEAALRRAESDREAASAERDRLVKEHAEALLAREFQDKRAAELAKLLQAREEEVAALRGTSQTLLAQNERSGAELAESRREARDATAARAAMREELEREKTEAARAVATAQARVAELARALEGREQELREAREGADAASTGLAEERARSQVQQQAHQARLDDLQATIAGLDSARAQVEAERAKVVGELELERTAGEAARTALREREGRVSELESALAQQAAQLAQLTGERDQARSERDQRIEGQARAEAAHQAERAKWADELSAAVDASAAQTAALSRVDGELREARAAISGLERELNQSQARHAAELSAREGEKAALAEQLEQATAAHARRVGELEAEIAQRQAAHEERAAELENKHSSALEALRTELEAERTAAAARDVDAQGRISGLTSDLEKATLRQAELESSLRQAEQGATDLAHKLAEDANGRIAEVQAQAMELEQALQRAEAEAARGRALLDEATSKSAEVEQRRASLEAELEAARGELERSRGATAEQLEELAALQSRLEDAEGQRRASAEAASAQQAAAAELQSRVEQQAATEARLRAQLEALENQLREVAELRGELDRRDAALVDLREQVDAQASRRKDVEQELAETERRAAASEQALGAARSELEAVRSELLRVEGESASRAEKLQALEVAIQQSEMAKAEAASVQSAAVDRLGAELEAAKQQAAEVERLRGELVETAKTQAGELEALRAKLARLESAEAVASAQAAELQRVQAQLSESEATLSQWSGELGSQRDLLAQLRAQVEDLQSALAQTESAGSQWKSRAEELEGSLAAAAEQTRALQASLAEREAELEQARAKAAAEPSPAIAMQLKAAEVRADSLQKERERLIRELDELGGVQRETERERLRFQELAGKTEAIQAELQKTLGELEQLNQRHATERGNHVATAKALEEERGRFNENLAKAVAKSTVEARMLRELSERQEAELKELRVKWARASAELNRLQAAHETVSASENIARNELAQLKSGEGILAASDLVDAMGLDLAKVKRLEARVRELEAQLKK